MSLKVIESLGAFLNYKNIFLFYIRKYGKQKMSFLDFLSIFSRFHVIFFFLFAKYKEKLGVYIFI